MDRKLLERLKLITDEEQKILAGNHKVEQQLYTSGRAFIIDSRRMLKKGKRIDIRTHTRFIPFPKHKHNYIEIIYMFSGKTTHIINDTDEVVLTEGNLLFLNQNAYHEIRQAEEEDIAINFIVLPEFFDTAFQMMEEENILKDFIVDSLRQDTRTSNYIHFKVAGIVPIQNLIENMVWSIFYKQPYKHKINQITMGLLFLQLLHYTETIEHSGMEQYENRIVLNVLKSIEENYKNISLTQLAIDMNQSLHQLSRLIKKTTGRSFKELLQRKRLNQAAYLLTSTNLPVADVITAVGYDNTSYFHKVFRERFELTPSKYRSLNGSMCK